MIAKQDMKKTSWIIFGFLSTLVGLYPIIYFLIDRRFGLLASKTPAVLNSIFWNIGFYGHIVPAGLALLIGWIQFDKRWRNKNLNLHRTVGKIYMISVLISGTCGLYIALFATGGIISTLGFASLGIIWLATTGLAYNSIKKGNVRLHQKYMIYSYAACFAAVTLRIWLPLLVVSLGDFITAYRIVAWLCWVPNLMVAYFLVDKRNEDPEKILA